MIVIENVWTCYGWEGWDVGVMLLEILFVDFPNGSRMSCNPGVANVRYVDFTECVCVDECVCDCACIFFLHI